MCTRDQQTAGAHVLRASRNSLMRHVTCPLSTCARAVPSLADRPCAHDLLTLTCGSASPLASASPVSVSRSRPRVASRPSSSFPPPLPLPPSRPAPGPPHFTLPHPRLGLAPSLLLFCPLSIVTSTLTLCHRPCDHHLSSSPPSSSYPILPLYHATHTHTHTHANTRPHPHTVTLPSALTCHAPDTTRLPALLAVRLPSCHCVSLSSSSALRERPLVQPSLSLPHQT